jgi:hypothetical protein
MYREANKEPVWENPILFHWSLNQEGFGTSDEKKAQINLYEGKLSKCDKDKGKVITVLIKHHAMKAYWGSGGVAPLILCPRH